MRRLKVIQQILYCSKIIQTRSILQQQFHSQFLHHAITSLKVYDILGKEVATLVNEEKQAGNYEVNFDAALLSSGTYFYRLSAENFSEVKKMILLK